MARCAMLGAALVGETSRERYRSSRSGACGRGGGLPVRHVVRGALVLSGLALLAMLAAPRLAVAQQTIGGCSVFPADNPWNRDVSNDPLDPNSAAYIASINQGGQFVHPDFGSDPSYGIPFIVVPGSQPLVQMTFN